MPATLYLIDGHALAYRTYFALTGAGGNVQRWTTSKGEPTAGIFGFASVLLRLLEQERPDYLAVAFDTGKTFRDDMFPDYKGTREKMPDDLRAQIERMRELVDAFNIPRLEMDGYEADDVLGSVAKKAAAQGLGVKIITGDRDLLQLVTARILVSLPGRKLSESQDYKPKDVKETLGVRPDQVVDYKALVGDTSDNIPGVAGIGEKTATSLLEKYGTLDKIYAHLDDLPAGQKKKLEEGRDNAYLSRDLARIVTDLDVDVDLEKARVDKFEPAAVQSLFRELEFRSLMPRLTTVMQLLGVADPSAPQGEQMTLFGEDGAEVEEETPAAVANPLDIDVTIVNTPKALADMVKQLSSAEQISFDTETTSVDKMQADLVGISLAIKPGHGYYVPVGHKPSLGAQLPIEDVMEAIRGPMTSKKIPKVGHNMKFDYVMLRRYGLDVEPLSFDTMLAEWVIDPGSRNLGLKSLAWVRLDVRMTEIEELIGKGKKQVTMAEVPIEKVAPYAVADAEVPLRLIPQLKSEMQKRKVTKLFETIEIPLIKVLSEMEMAGVALDLNFLKRLSAELDERMEQIQAKVYKAVGGEFNLNSTQQLSDALFEKLKLTPPDGVRKTASGFYSTSAEVLDALRPQHKIIDWLMEFRELSKLQSTYVEALPTQVNPVTKRVHTSYSQSGTVTGRIASTDPNLQNIPIRTEQGRQVRDAFIAEKGNLLLSVDYSQIELRIVAHMAEDKAMLTAFRAGQDIHATTAAAVFKIDLDKVTPEQRRHAKAINFGLIYGMSAFGLTRSTELTLAESEDFVDAYFKQFPNVKKYLDGVRKQAAEQEYVETLLGRRRYFHGLQKQAAVVRSRLEREAINSPIQGTAADIMKLAMLAVPSALKKAGLQGRMLLQVHDELVLECPKEELAETARVAQEKMASAYELKVPLQTEARAGVNWGKMTPVEA